MTLTSFPVDLNNPLHLALAHAYRNDPAAWGGQVGDIHEKRDVYMDFLARRVSQHPENIMFVREGDVIVGMYEIGSKKDETQMGYMNFIYVTPDLRGKGYGKRVMQLAEGALRARGFSAMMLTSKMTHEYNAKFYSGQGFANKGERADRPGCYFWEKKIA